MTMEAPAATQAAPPMEDPAPPAHLAIASALVADCMRRLVQFLEEVELADGVAYGAMRDARAALEEAGGFIGDDDATCKRYWEIDEALNELHRWQNAVEGNEDGRPDWSWDRDMRRAISAALEAARWLQANRPAHADAARWTNDAWGLADARVRAQGGAA